VSSLAGTDLCYPPVGSWIADWGVAPGVDPATLQPYAKQTCDAAAYADMRAFRKPFIAVHEIGFYLLPGLMSIHVLAVVITELREGGNLISAMFTGRKSLDKGPADKTSTDQ
jgi:Ni/Fe-hydrogenase 1 B-type cytochrome subunit